jgi:hypothetical protein
MVLHGCIIMGVHGLSAGKATLIVLIFPMFFVGLAMIALILFAIILIFAIGAEFAGEALPGLFEFIEWFPGTPPPGRPRGSHPLIQAAPALTRLCWRMTVGMEKGERTRRPRQGDHKGAPLLYLRSGLPGSSIGGAHPCGRPVVGPGCGGNRLYIAFASKVFLRRG